MARKGLEIYRHGEAPPLGNDMMEPATVAPAVLAELDLMQLAASGPVDVLYRGDEDNSMSLVRGRFNPGFILPRHSHDADCLYYVVSGTAILGRQVLEAGDGFFVPAGAPYTYEAGPDGVEVLEFRTSTKFDMKMADDTVDRWRPMVDAATEHQEEWLERNAARASS